MVTETQKQILKDSWAEVKSSGAIEDRGREMFLRLFKENMELLPLYSFKDDDTEEKLRTSRRLIRHGTKVMTSVDAAISGLDDMDTVGEFLTGLGERHATYGAKNDHFGPVFGALIHTLQNCLGDSWRPETEEAWKALFKVLTQVMGGSMPGEVPAEYAA